MNEIIKEWYRGIASKGGHARVQAIGPERVREIACAASKAAQEAKARRAAMKCPQCKRSPTCVEDENSINEENQCLPCEKAASMYDNE